ERGRGGGGAGGGRSGGPDSGCGEVVDRLAEAPAKVGPRRAALAARDRRRGAALAAGRVARRVRGRYAHPRGNDRDAHLVAERLIEGGTPADVAPPIPFPP